MAIAPRQSEEPDMAHATRGFAATFVASALALTACSGGGDNVRGGGEAENQANHTEGPFAPSNGTVDTPTDNGAEAALRNAPASEELNAAKME
jgi:hypothetical protein